MFVFLPLSVLLALCFAAAAYFIHAPRLPVPALGGTLERRQLEHGGHTRHYLLYRPTVSHKPQALLIVLHGSRQDGQAMRNATGYAFERLAQQRGFIVAYPDGYGRHWNDVRKAANFSARKQNIDDIGFIGQIIDSLSDKSIIDSGRVYLFGYSNGAHLAYRLAFEAPQQVAGIAAVAAGLATDGNLLAAPAGRVPPVLIINGTIDPINPHEGGPVTLFGFGDRGTVRSSLATAEYFACLNGAVERPATTLEAIFDNDPSKAERRAWQLAGQDNVVLYSIEGGGHVIPQPYGRMPRLLGLKSSALDATRVACDFFKL